MKVSIISQNLQGLNDDNKWKKVQDYYRRHLGSVDIICTQETKIRGMKFSSLPNLFWQGAKFYGCEAQVAYNNEMRDDGAGCGGIGMWISPKIAHLVHSQGFSSNGQAQWVRLSGLPGGDIAILNVYCPHNSPQRCLLWEELMNSLPQGCRWIALGDWNFVEHARDKSNNRATNRTIEEKRLFHEFKALLQVEDNFPRSNKIKFSWDNRRVDGQRILARLDRAYVFEGSQSQPSYHSYRIFGDTSFSDHLPVWREVHLTTFKANPSRYILNSYFLKDEAVKENIKNIWAINFHLPFFGKIRRVIKFYKEFCLKKARDRRMEEDLARKNIVSAMTSLQDNVCIREAQDHFSMQLDKLREIEDKRIKGQQLRSKFKWMEVGDSCSKEFFASKKTRSSASRITELEDEHGTKHMSQKDLENICQHYYEKLYKARPQVNINEAEGEKLLQYLDKRLTPSMCEDLKKNITSGELRKALFDMKLGKSPGPDGITCEFFPEYWGLVGDEFTNMVLESIAIGKFPSGVTKGMIALLHKGGSRAVLTNWRPISLLNISYKIYAKALQLRLQPVLMDVISPEQSAFCLLDSFWTTYYSLMKLWRGPSNHPNLYYSSNLTSLRRMTW